MVRLTVLAWTFQLRVPEDRPSTSDLDGAEPHKAIPIPSPHSLPDFRPTSDGEDKELDLPSSGDKLPEKGHDSKSSSRYSPEGANNMGGKLWRFYLCFV